MKVHKDSLAGQMLLCLLKATRGRKGSLGMNNLRVGHHTYSSTHKEVVGNHLKLCDVIVVMCVLVNNKPTVSWAEQDQERFRNRLNNTHIPLQKKITIISLFLLYEVRVLHPEDTLAAAVSHQLVSQVLRPVRPLVRPAAVPREATPRVPQSQQPEAWAESDMEGGRRSTGR